MDNIDLFLDDRKEKWLKDRLKKAKDDQEVQSLQNEANEKFQLSTWVMDAAKRANQLSMVSHIGKFTHPSAKNSEVIANSNAEHDGYLRSGNVHYALDVLGNAAAMDVYKFLSIVLEDGSDVLTHIEQKTDVIVKRFNMDYATYQAISDGLLSIKKTNSTSLSKTDSLLKQVYFPVTQEKGQYHLLSILTPSGMVTKLKQRIDAMRFSDTAKLARDSRKKERYIADGYDDLINLTQISFGGSKPQNISVLNNKNAGLAYLLPSVPPFLEKRTVRLPVKDFFNELQKKYISKDNLNKLVKLIKLSINNVDIRDKIRLGICTIVDDIVMYVHQVRQFDIGWSEKEYYQYLPKSQRIWLDDVHKDVRSENDEWLVSVCEDMARWISDLITKKFPKNDPIIGSAEFQYVLDLVNKTVKTDMKEWQ